MTTWTIPEIETERLRLRAPKLEDLPRVTDFWASDRSHIVGGPRSEVEASRSLFSVFGFWALRGAGMWYIADRATDAFLGFTGFMYGPGWDEPEIGWTVMQEAEGKGIAFEAAQAARTKLNALGHGGLISYIRADNDRSLALARRLGATYERDGTLLGAAVQVWRHPSTLPERMGA